MNFPLIKAAVIFIKKDFDATEHGGAPLLGISKPVIKAHGSSNAKAIKNAIRQAMSFASLDTESLIGGKMADAE